MRTLVGSMKDIKNSRNRTKNTKIFLGKSLPAMASMNALIFENIMIKYMDIFRLGAINPFVILMKNFCLSALHIKKEILFLTKL